MGRELRRVPADWKHPRSPSGEYFPLHDFSYRTAVNEWTEEVTRWRADHPLGTDAEQDDWVGKAPNPIYYRPYWPEESRTHFQVYETVSEGTPISPPLPSKEAVVEWLVTHPDVNWGEITREQAEMFVKNGYAITMMSFGGRVYGPYEYPLVLTE